MNRKPDYEFYDYTVVLSLFESDPLWNDKYSQVKGGYTNHKYETHQLPKRLVSYLEMLGEGSNNLGVCSIIEYVLRENLEDFSRKIHKNGDVTFYPAQYNEFTGEGNYISKGIELHVEYVRGNVSGVSLVARYKEGWDE